MVNLFEDLEKEIKETLKDLATFEIRCAKLEVQNAYLWIAVICETMIIGCLFFGD